MSTPFNLPRDKGRTCWRCSVVDWSSDLSFPGLKVLSSHDTLVGVCMIALILHTTLRTDRVLVWAVVWPIWRPIFYLCFPTIDYTEVKFLSQISSQSKRYKFVIIIWLNHLFAYLLNSPKINYKLSTSKRNNNSNNWTHTQERNKKQDTCFIKSVITIPLVQSRQPLCGENKKRYTYINLEYN
jgi:hypothetical protein